MITIKKFFFLCVNLLTINDHLIIKPTYKKKKIIIIKQYIKEIK